MLISRRSVAPKFYALDLNIALNKYCLAKNVGYTKSSRSGHFYSVNHQNQKIRVKEADKELGVLCQGPLVH